MTKPLVHKLRFLAVSVTAGFVLLSSMSAPAGADDAPPGGFPSWSDVEQAKGNAAATAAEVQKISQLLDSLEDEAGKLGMAAVKSGGDFALTQMKLDSLTAEVGVLGAQADRAAEEAEKYKQAAVAVAVQSYKNGGTGLGIFATVSALESPESLKGVEMLQKVGERAASQQEKATQTQAVAAALGKSRAEAQDEQRELTALAGSQRDAAVAAQAAVTQQLNLQKGQSETLMAQLASLNKTTIAQEQKFRQGQGALAAYEQVQAAKRQAAADLAARRAAEESREQAVAQPAPVAPNPVIPNPVVPNPVVPNPVPKPVIPPPAPAKPVIPEEVVTPNVPGGAVNDPAGARSYASSRLGAYGWVGKEFQCLNLLWERESNWRTNATNPYSGAYGIAQALPANKYAEEGPDWLTNYRTQINWGLGYIKGRYGSPCGAWNHSETVGWY